MTTDTESDPRWDNLKAAIDQMAAMDEESDFHINPVLAEQAKSRLDSLRFQNFPPPRLLPESGGELSFVWRENGWTMYHCFSLADGQYSDMHYFPPTAVPGQQLSDGLSDTEKSLIEAVEWFIENDETNRGGEWETTNAYWIAGIERGRKAVADAKGIPYTPEDMNSDVPTKFTIPGAWGC